MLGLSLGFGSSVVRRIATYTSSPSAVPLQYHPNALSTTLQFLYECGVWPSSLLCHYWHHTEHGEHQDGKRECRCGSRRRDCGSIRLNSNPTPGDIRTPIITLFSQAISLFSSSRSLFNPNPNPTPTPTLPLRA